LRKTDGVITIRRRTAHLSRKIDITGQRFNKLIAIRYNHMTPNSGQVWLFLCDCGNEKVVTVHDVKRGHSTSCGCHNKTKNITHGRSSHPMFVIWKTIRSRCYNEKSKDYGRYGGRGIVMCDEWRDSFESFYRDMGDRPPEHTIDRIDNDLGYSKGNCRWCTTKEQGRNKRNTIFVEYNGEKRPLIEVCEELSINYGSVANRIRRLGWSSERALNTPFNNNQQK
jgi:hypothetical protein